MKKITSGSGFRIILFTGLILSMSGCRSFKNVRIGDIQSIRIEKVSMQQVHFNLQVPIENPKRIPFRIVDMDLKLAFDGRYLGKVSNLDTIKVSGKSREIHDVNMRLQLPGLVGALNAISVLKEDAGNLSLTGDLKIKYLWLAGKQIEVEESQYVDMKGWNRH